MEQRKRDHQRRSNCYAATLGSGGGGASGIDWDLTLPTLPEGLVFARAGTRTYIGADQKLYTAAENVWPVEYDVTTGECLGRGLYSYSFNYCQWSQNFSNAVWVKTGVTVAAITGIDGVASSGSRLTATQANATIFQTLAGMSYSWWTSSVYIRRVSGTGQVSLQAGTVTQNVTLTTSWQRLAVSEASADPVFGIKMATSGDVIEVCFWQQEQTRMASPYIRNDTAWRTYRESDYAAIEDASQFAAAEGTLYIDTYMPYAQNTVCLWSFIAASGSASNFFRLDQSGYGDPRIVARKAGSDTSQGIFPAASVALGARMKVGVTWTATQAIIAVNNASIVSTDMRVPTLGAGAVDRLYLAGSPFDTPWGSCYRRITYLRTAKSDADLKAMTV